MAACADAGLTGARYASGVTGTVPDDLHGTPRSTRPSAPDYPLLARQVRSLIEAERDWLANLANVVAAVYQAVPGLNWAGFYLLKEEELVLGPFQGLPACIRIPIGSGVCGTAVAEARTQIVDDVHAFPGHIACDPRSRSEIVVPVRDVAGTIRGVLDLDSARHGNFGPADGEGLASLVAELAGAIDWERACAS